MGGSLHGDRTHRTTAKHARGASAVELALLAPFLILLFLGAVDTSWLLIQNLDVKHAAREGGRLAATSSGDTTAIGSRVCSSMDNDSATTVDLAGSSGGLGDEIQITVRKQAQVITGLTDWAFNPPVNLTSTSTFRIEFLPVTWTDGTHTC